MYRAGGAHEQCRHPATGYHGEVALDRDTAKVLRLTAVADHVPPEANILESTVTIDYDFIDVAGKTYLLPSHSDARMTRPHRQVGNAVTFTGYRKFEAESTIDFGGRGR